MNKIKIATCALCLFEKELQNSHIIPEFIYEHLYDDKHRYHVLSTTVKDYKRMSQKGVRESLLCKDCERKLSKWERYASLVLKGGLELEAEVAADGRAVTINGVDYQSFKLFQLSILWRAGVSTLKMFNQVKLGPYAETLRLMLLNNDAGNDDDFGCIMHALVYENDKVVTDLIAEPSIIKCNSNTYYQFIFGGFEWIFCVSKNKSSPIRSLFLQPSGRLFFGISHIDEITSITKFSKEFHLINKLKSLSKGTRYS
jgi:hypothetical protein